MIMTTGVDLEGSKKVNEPTLGAALFTDAIQSAAPAGDLGH